MNLHKAFIVSLGIIFSPYCSLANAQTTLIDLTGFGNGFSEATAINNSGQIVGYSGVGNNVNAFSYTNGRYSDLGTVGGLDSYALGINSSGKVTGYSSTNTGNGDSNFSAFLYSSGVMSNLSTLTGDSLYIGTAINNSGQIVGDTGANQAFVYSSASGVSSIGTLGTFSSSSAKGINNSGQVVGLSQLSGNIYHAFTYSETTGIKDLFPTSGAIDSSADSINDLGEITGSYNDEAYIYSEASGLQLLGSDTTAGVAINDAGDVVGGGTTGSFVYSPSSGVQYLDFLYSSLLVSNFGSQKGFVSLDVVNDINDLGDMVGYGTYWNGSTDETQAFLLEPAAAPEPTTMSVLLGSLVFLILMRIRGYKA